MRKHCVLGIIICLVLLCISPIQGLRGSGFPQDPSSSQVEVPTEGSDTQPKKTYGGPKNITENIAIYVFLGWLWLSILVLIYLLRLKVKECDRLHNFEYYTAVQKKPLDT